MIRYLTLLGMFTTVFARGETLKQISTETHPLDQNGEIRIENANGAISIHTWNRAEVLIQVEKRASSEEALKEIQIDMDSAPDIFSVKTTLPSHVFGWLFGEAGADEEVRLTLTVPAHAKLGRISSVNGGITIDGALGTVTAGTVNGAIHATGIENDAKFTTVNGPIHAEVSVLKADGHLNFSTINGPIVVLLPKDVDATVSATTINGRVSCDFPIRIEDSGPRIFSNLKGTIGTGKAAIGAKTINGEINLRSS